MATVTKIPSTINMQTKLPFLSKKKRRVAAYARVSTDSDEQATSYDAQIQYYTDYIKANPDWEFVGMYADEGISGTSTKNRKQFLKMIEEAKAGNIDLILTKSVSRFARNTVDTLTYIRELKAKGIEVYFQKENIYTLDAKGELLITIMSSLAQEESRSISENVTWGKRVAFSQGKIYIPYGAFLGYERGEDGKPKIVDEEAKVVKAIYSLFLEGLAPTGIAKILMENGIKTPGVKTKWQVTTILSILKNEKYKGDALLQKSFITDFLSHKAKKNEGEVPQYYVQNSHEAIIEPNEWDFVQIELERRAKLGMSYSSNSSFASKVVCADCGGIYGSKVWHSNTPYRKTIWQCNHKFQKESKAQCKTPTLTEEEIKAKFIEAYNEVMGKKETMIEDAELILEVVSDTAELDLKLIKAQEEVELVALAARKLIDENAKVALSQEEFEKKYSALTSRYETEVATLEKLQTEKKKVESRIVEIKCFLKTFLEQPDILEEWDLRVFNFMIEKAVVHQNKEIEFCFYNGRKVRI